MIERVVAYDIGFDERKPVNSIYIRRQVETHIGERLNVLLSRTRYGLRDGLIFAQADNEPFIDVLKRGRDYRRENGSEVDFAREDAEVSGFLKIQEILGHPTTPIDTMMLSVSPKGGEESSYQHNFYDIFTKTADGIEARRYSSALSYEEYAKFLGLNFIPSDSYFLSNPVRVYDKSPDDIHGFLHKEHDYLAEDDFRIILEVCRPFIYAYIKLLSETDDRKLHALAFNAILNVSDRARADLELLKSGKLTYINKYMDSINSSMIYKWGIMPVRQTMTGCGSSGDASLDSLPFSVSEFGKEKQEWFKCPKCGWEASGPIGNGPCGRCGLTKEKFAKEGGKVCA